MDDTGQTIGIPTYRALTPENERRALTRLDVQCALSIAEVEAELISIPYVGLLVRNLVNVFQAVERSRVNKEQWKLLQGRCVMVLRIAGARVMNNGRQNYPHGNEGAQRLEDTLNKIRDRAHYYTQMNEAIAFLKYHTISCEIENLFGELDVCLQSFSCNIGTSKAQWAVEFQSVQQKEAREIQRVESELREIISNLDEINKEDDPTPENLDRVANALQQVIVKKSSILSERSSTDVDTYLDAQQIVRTIISTTTLRPPLNLLLGRQCSLESNIPVRSGITCDIFLASFLHEQKVAKKVFRLGISDKEFVEKYAKRFMRIAELWYDFRSDYTLPFYGIGMETFWGTDHFQLYMVSPLMKNFDAITYLKQYRKNAGMKKNILRIISDAARGLQYLHSRHPPVVHSGMRGDNVLITDSGGAVLGGFGLTKALENHEDSGIPPAVMTGKTESQRWMGPEMFVDKPILEPACDVWSWAMTALEIVSGSVPYHKYKQAITIVLKVSQGPPKRQDYPEFNSYAYRPGELWELFMKCWEAEPGDRLTADEVVEKLEEIAAMPEGGM